MFIDTKFALPRTKCQGLPGTMLGDLPAFVICQFQPVGISACLVIATYHQYPQSCKKELTTSSLVKVNMHRLH